ncbi:sulfite oxidase heme-binding subunit YedZ [Methylophaga sp. OBS3]|uniref:sulfite oxidase heme-binding subunit YedZ n=1 Tax=Methylophaga sp. OBS3 TaxID=2991934 RepID=UPI00225186B6|nr:protein-methionine-sulfoxide reductase heme-binding subunit MsrQ [Methylophaga sp. OBS3]
MPAIWLTYALFTDQLGANPIEAITRDSGTWALRFLLLTLTLTPIRWLTGFNQIIRFRRMAGLFVFFYAVTHMLLYLWLDQFFDWTEILKDIIKRPFITIGFISMLLLLPLVITSTNKMMKRLGGQRWKQLHKLTYVVAALSCLHFLMLVKADITEPVIYIVILSLLFAVRIYRQIFKTVALART